MKKFYKYTLTSIALLFALIIIIFISINMYYRVIPSIILYRTLNDFENACYSNNYERIISLISRNSILYNLVEKNKGASFIYLFNKFKQGFEIQFKSVGRTNFEKYNNSPAYTCNIFKVAKIDNQVREFNFITVIYENEKWKIHQYAFPDFINY